LTADFLLFTCAQFDDVRS